MRKRRKQAESPAPDLQPKRITPVDIQQKEFRLAVRGYNERDVDQFLDEVTEEVAHLYADNKRLREEIEFSRTTRLETTGTAEAEAIVRQAREEAARIIAEATARASTIGASTVGASSSASDDPGPPDGPRGFGSGTPPTEIMGLFLARERAFLQNMANLIQAHAEGVKQDVRRVREQVARPAPASQAPAQAPAQESGEAAPTERPPGEPGEALDEAPGAERDTPTPADEGAFAHTAADQPTQAWRGADAERSQGEIPRQEIVDLTRSGEEGAEDADELRTGRATEQSVAGPGTGEEGALSRAYRPNRASLETGPTGPTTPTGTRGPDAREARVAGNVGPRVEDEDAREDRSLRELFWGED
jgi:cell division initiation protein